MKEERIDLESLRSKTYEKNAKKSVNPCFLCGKETDKRIYIHYLETGEIVNTFEDHAQSQGIFPIGSSCAKKIPKEFISKE